MNVVRGVIIRYPRAVPGGSAARLARQHTAGEKAMRTSAGTLFRRHEVE
jgi:hypothetical protein